jgi:hypothetical protein
MLISIYSGGMRMKTKYKMILALMLALVLMVCMGSCGRKDDGGAADTSADTQNEENADTAEDEEMPEVVKTIEGVDEDLGPREPLQIDSITLYADGSVAIVPVDDLKKNEIKDDAQAVYPFKESGKVEDVAVADYGNGGYRTIVALMKDGTISVVNGRALVEDHIFAVIDNVANRDTFVEIQNVEQEDGYYIVGVTEDGNEVILDYAMSFDEPEEQ